MVILYGLGDIQTVNENSIQVAVFVWHECKSVFSAIVYVNISYVIGKIGIIVDGDFTMIGKSQDQRGVFDNFLYVLAPVPVGSRLEQVLTNPLGTYRVASSLQYQKAYCPVSNTSVIYEVTGLSCRVAAPFMIKAWIHIALTM